MDIPDAGGADNERKEVHRLCLCFPGRTHKLGFCAPWDFAFPQASCPHPFPLTGSLYHDNQRYFSPLFFENLGCRDWDCAPYDRFALGRS